MPADDGIFDERIASTYDDPDDEMWTAVAIDPVVDVLAGLAGDGRALEFAIGTGRIAVPLAARGVPVVGIELSNAMVARMRAKPGGAGIPVAIGDIATTTVEGTFSVVFLVWPAELDLMAEMAGMRLRDRWAGWKQEPFSSESRSHVSVWKKPAG